MGEQCRRFEEAFAEAQGRRKAVLLNSRCSANFTASQSLNSTGRLKTGDRVGFSALTWYMNVMPIIQMGFEPVPIDCQRNTLNAFFANLARSV
jgi:CDP-4-dehydro-6-deoxyglucose reductase, E1